MAAPPIISDNLSKAITLCTLRLGRSQQRLGCAGPHGHAAVWPMGRQICQEYPKLSAAGEAGSPINPVAAGGATPKPLKRAWLRGALPFGTATGSSSSGVRRCHWLAPGAPRRRRSLFLRRLLATRCSARRPRVRRQPRGGIQLRMPVTLSSPLSCFFLFCLMFGQSPLGSGPQWLCFLTQCRRMRTLYGLTETIYGEHGKLGGLDPSFML